MPPIHQHLVAGRWMRFTLAEQLANIGSEVSRILHWRESGDRTASEHALQRALELLDLTLANSRPAARLRELARLRDVLCAVFLSSDEYDIPSDALENYFLPFALRIQH